MVEPPSKAVDPNPLISGLMQFSEDGKSIYYPIKEKGASNLVRQPLERRTGDASDQLQGSGYSRLCL